MASNVGSRHPRADHRVDTTRDTTRRAFDTFRCKQRPSERATAVFSAYILPNREHTRSKPCRLSEGIRLNRHKFEIMSQTVAIACLIDDIRHNELYCYKYDQHYL